MQMLTNNEHTLANLILVIRIVCDLILVMIASKCQVGMPVFQPLYEVKSKMSKFEVLAIWSQWRYPDQI